VLGSGIVGHAPSLTATGSEEMKTADPLILQVMSCRVLLIRFAWQRLYWILKNPVTYHSVLSFLLFFDLFVRAFVSLFFYEFLRFFLPSSLHPLPLFLIGVNGTWWLGIYSETR
jgi:hypothetical protein